MVFSLCKDLQALWDFDAIKQMFDAAHLNQM